MSELSDRLLRVAVHGVVPENDQHVIADAQAEIERLRAAVWDYGEHTIKCTVRDGKECDCGFFELLETVPQPGLSQQRTTDLKEG